jgi:hypothetical protein
MKLKDITVEQFIKLAQIEEAFKEDESKMSVEIAKLFFPKDNLKVKELKEFSNNLKKALETKPQFIQRFKHNGIEYGFIPNLEEISTGEYIDLDNYQRSKDTYHKMLGILYRPIVKSYGKLYQIEKYEGTKYENEMKEVSCEILLGSIQFFFRLLKIMGRDSLTYSQTLANKMMKNPLISQMKEDSMKDTTGIA